MDVIGGRHRLYVNSEKFYLKGDPTYDVGGMKQSEITTPERRSFRKLTYLAASAVQSHLCRILTW